MAIVLLSLAWLIAIILKLEQQHQKYTQPIYQFSLLLFLILPWPPSRASSSSWPFNWVQALFCVCLCPPTRHTSPWVTTVLDLNIISVNAAPLHVRAFGGQQWFSTHTHSSSGRRSLIASFVASFVIYTFLNLWFIRVPAVSSVRTVQSTWLPRIRYIWWARVRMQTSDGASIFFPQFYPLLCFIGLFIIIIITSSCKKDICETF